MRPCNVKTASNERAGTQIFFRTFANSRTYTPPVPVRSRVIARVTHAAAAPLSDERCDIAPRQLEVIIVQVIHPAFFRSSAALVASLLTVSAVAPLRSASTLQASTERPTPRPVSAAAAPARTAADLATMPLHFEAREMERARAFVARGHGYNVSISPRGAAVALVAGGRRADVTFSVAGSTGAQRLVGETRLPGVVNRYVGARAGWQSGIETYGRVVAEQVRPGIDVVYYGNQRQLEYDFVVAPGASPDDAAMIVHGADRLEIDRTTGDLLVHVSGHTLRQQAPIAYQDVRGMRMPVESAFTLDAAARRVGFRVGQYDRTRPLVIDPVLVYSSWFGGTSEEGILAVKVDADGFIYVLGTSEDHAGFPTTPGAYQPQRAGTPSPGGLYPRDYFVSKFNPAGTALVYSTLFGGTLNEGTWAPEYIPGGLAVDAQGRVHIVGDTLSPDFPVTPDAADPTFGFDAGQPSQSADAFYTRLTPGGGLSYSTYIGGTRREAATGVAVDAQGNAYVVGKTASNSTTDGFVTTPNAYRTTRWGTDDLFVQRYTEAGELVYSTYFGGSQGEMTNRADVVANGNGKVTFGSDTSTGDLPTLNGFAPRLGNSTDGFVSQIDTNIAGTAGLLYSTYISGTDTDHVYALDIDAAGFVYVGGRSRSDTDFPVTPGAARQFNTPVGGGQEPWDGFVIKLDLTKTGAASRVYSTFAGGNNTETLNDIAVDPMGRVHLVGSTRSVDLPQLGALEGFQLWQMPPYVQILNPTGTAFVFSSYVGSNTNGQALYAIATNAAGETYLGGTTNDGGAYSDKNLDGFRLVNPFQTAFGGGDGDAVLQKLGYSVDLSLTKTANVTTLLPGQNVTFTLQVVNPSTDPASGVVITDNLPAGLEYVSCAPSAGGICSAAGNNVSVSFGQLAPAATATVQIVAKLVATTPGQQIMNTATVTAGVLDPVPANNTASATIGLPTLEPTGDADGDGLSNDFETRYGLDPFGGPGSGPGDDPDGDGKTNLQELLEGTHPRGFVITYLAEGATGAFFDTRLALANPTGTTALVLTRFQKGDGTIVRHYTTIAPMSRATIDVEALAGLEAAEFSTLVEADVQVVADRTMTWDQSGYGSHAERGILTRTATKWYFAEGATFGNFNLFYLVQNPNDQDAQVKVTYLLPSGAPLIKHYVVEAQSRFNIWVDDEGATDPALAPLANAELSAIVESTNGVPIIAERAMYLDKPGRPLGAGHESAGVTAPATQWFLAEGATGNYFDLFILIANPQATPATVQADFLLGSGQVITKTYEVGGSSRFNIWVDQADAALADVAVSTRITSTNGVPIIVERAMWWPGPTSDTWHEAHNSPGETTTGTRWAMAEGELGGARETETYVLIANTSPVAGRIRATVLFEDGTAPIAREYDIAANARFNIAPAANEFFPETRGKRFGMIVESLGGAPVEIVVERAMYTDAAGVRWAAGTNALATKLQ